MKQFVYISFFLLIIMVGCQNIKDQLPVSVYETSAGGNKLSLVKDHHETDDPVILNLNPDQTFQDIIGFGGSFTESSAYLLNQLSEKNRDSILQAYFGNDGARYSLTRTHINSCDFSLDHYAYVSDQPDPELTTFSIDEDRDDIIPMIRDAMHISKDGFKIISSPWTAPPWMKDNKSWVGGKLLPGYYATWARYFTKYLEAYRKENIDIWAVTVENEPLGNGNNWESMHFTPQEMVDFVDNHLGPEIENNGQDVKILGYDQNRGEELKEWADIIYKNENTARYFDGFAVHWYASTYEVFGNSLQYVHSLAPEKLLIQTEACVDSEVPHWKDDQWYWSKEATDWGWDWAPEDQKYLHPKYVPAYRYARDIIGCLNNRVQGWIDWNMALDKQGGPNWFENWCVAPVIVDPGSDEVYFTPLYYIMAHFSRFIRPDAKRIGFELNDDSLLATAAQNPDGSIAVVILNMQKNPVSYKLSLNNKSKNINISGQAIQTIIVNQP